MGFFDRFRKTETKKETQTKKRAKNILVAHRGLTVAELIKGILEKAGYNVIGATSNGRRAIQLFADERPDLVVLDIPLDEIDGIEVCKTMKTLSPDIPIIMYSSMGQETLVIETIKAGACEFVLSNGFETRNRLIDSIKKHIG